LTKKHGNTYPHNADLLKYNRNIIPKHFTQIERSTNVNIFIFRLFVIIQTYVWYLLVIS